MIRLVPPAGRLLILAGVLALALAACGRRGQLEPPPDPSAPRATASAAADDDAPESLVPSASPTPPRRARQGYTIPKEPFVLDPLL